MSGLQVKSKQKKDDKGDDVKYESFPGIVLTDTFQINERDGDMLDQIFPINSKRVLTAERHAYPGGAGQPALLVRAKQRQRQQCQPVVSQTGSEHCNELCRTFHCHEQKQPVRLLYPGLPLGF